LPEVGFWRNCPKLSNKILVPPLGENCFRYAALRLALGRRECLSVDIHCDPAVRVPEQLLHNLYVFTVAKQGGIRVPESAPSDTLGEVLG